MEATDRSTVTDTSPAVGTDATASTPPTARSTSSVAGQVKVSVAYPVDSFDTHLDGVPVLTTEPQDVPNSSLEEVRNLAAQANVPLKVEGE